MAYQERYDFDKVLTIVVWEANVRRNVIKHQRIIATVKTA